jgi:Flp pilus assembly protein TadG
MALAVLTEVQLMTPNAKARQTGWSQHADMTSRRRGASAVEFAVVAPVFFVLISVWSNSAAP